MKEHEKKHVVHCLRCARVVSKGDFTSWICLGKLRTFRGNIKYSFLAEEYEIDRLKNIFDNFVLGGGIQQTQENPLKLAMVNNNIQHQAAAVKSDVL